MPFPARSWPVQCFLVLCLVDDPCVFECLVVFECLPCLCVLLLFEVELPVVEAVPVVPVDVVVGVPDVPELWPLPRATALTHWPWFCVLPVVAVPVAVPVVVGVPLPEFPCGHVCAAWLTSAP